MCVYSRRYPSCIVHAPYYIISGLSGSIIFVHIVPITACFLGKRVIDCEHCVLIFSATFFETFLILRRIQRDITVKVHGFSLEVTIIHRTFYSNLNFLHKFSNNPQVSNYVKICQHKRVKLDEKQVLFT